MSLIRVLAIAAALVSSGASAQPAPSLIPTRDVVITYRVLGGEGAPPIEMAWLAAAAGLRAEVPGVGWSVSDTGNGVGFLVMERLRRIMELPPRAFEGQLLPPFESRFTRDGTRRILGQSCTDWRYEGAGQTGRVCLTAEGVMLRNAITAGAPPGGGSGLEATQLRFEPQDPNRFMLPPDYARIPAPGPRERPAR